MLLTLDALLLKEFLLLLDDEEDAPWKLLNLTVTLAPFGGNCLRLVEKRFILSGERKMEKKKKD